MVCVRLTSDTSAFFIKFTMLTLLNIPRSFNNSSYDDIRSETFDTGLLTKEVTRLLISNVMCLLYDDRLLYSHDLSN